VHVFIKVTDMKSMISWTVLLKSSLKAFAIALLLLVATERQAMAYTDPGTGALIWQTLVAGAIGLMYYLRRYITWFRNRRGKKP
jgi:hypothetical protein